MTKEAQNFRNEKNKKKKDWSKMSPEQQAQSFIEMLYRTLQKEYKNEAGVSAEQIETCMKKRNWRYPYIMKSFDKMLDEMYEQFGKIERSGTKPLLNLKERWDIASITLADLHDKIKQTYSGLDVSEETVRGLIKENSILQEYGNFNGLMMELYRRFGKNERKDETGGMVKSFLKLRETPAIPEEVRQKVRNAVRAELSEKTEVDCAYIGNIFQRDYGIDFKSLGFPDLTSFLREFPELFSLKGDIRGNVIRMYAQINQANLESIKQEKEPELEELKGYIEKGEYERFISEYGKNIAGWKKASFWEMLIVAIARSEERENKVPAKETLTDWEKSVLTYDADIIKKANDDEYMEKNGFSKKQTALIKKSLVEYSENVAFHALGQRVKNLCGEGNVLEYYCYRLGLICGRERNKQKCVQELILFCANRQEELDQNFWNDLAKKFWNAYKHNYIEKFAMDNLVTKLYERKNFVVFYEIMKDKNKLKNLTQVEDYARIERYKPYADVIKEDKLTKEGLPAIYDLKEDVQMRMVDTLFEELLRKKQVETYCKVFCLFLQYPDKYISKVRLDRCVEKQRKLVFSVWNILLEKATGWMDEAWTVINYLLPTGLFDEKKQEWEEQKNIFKKEAMSLMEAEETEERKEEIRTALLRRFPNDVELVDANYQTMVKRLLAGSTEERKREFDRLILDKNIAMLRLLYENKEVKIPRDAKIWNYLNKSYGSLKEENLQYAVETKYWEITALEEEKREIAKTKFIELLEYVSIRTYQIHLEKALADNILSEFETYVVDEDKASTYVIAMIVLALQAQRPALAALMYVLCGENQKELVLQRLGQETLTCWRKERYIKYIGDSLDVYRYILATEDLNTILQYGKLASKVIYEAETKDYSYEEIDKNEIEVDPFIKNCIRKYHVNESWNRLSRYFVRNERSHLDNYKANYTTNLMLVYHFGDFHYPLTNCTNSLKDRQIDVLPVNLISNNLLLLEKKHGIARYWEVFARCMKENQLFQNQNFDGSKYVKGYYEQLAQQELSTLKERDAICQVALIILEQTGTYEAFFELFLEESEHILDALLSNKHNALKFLVLVGCEGFQPENTKWKELIELVRVKMKEFQLNSTLLRWLDMIFAKQEEKEEDRAFLMFTRKLLISYPEQPKEDIIDTEFLDKERITTQNYILIRNWLEVFGRHKNNKKAYDYMLEQEISKEQFDQAGNKICEQLHWIVQKLLTYWEPRENQKEEYMQVCKNYLALKYLIDAQMETDELEEKIQKIIKNNRGKESYSKYKEALKTYWDSGIEYKERKWILYCGITQKWWSFFSEMQNNLDKVPILKQPLNEYLKALGTRSFYRELLKMYVYVCVAKLRSEGNSTDHILKGTRPEIEQMHKEMQEGDFHFEDYRYRIEKIAEAFSPMLAKVMRTVSESANDTEMMERLLAVNVARRKQTSKNKAGALEKNKTGYYKEIIIPCLLSLQEPEYIAYILEKWAYSTFELFSEFIGNKEIKEVLGEVAVFYYSAIYWVQKEEIGKAKGCLEQIKEIPAGMAMAIEEVKEAIEQGRELQRFHSAADVIQIAGLIKLSFMETEDPQQIEFEQLVSAFYSQNNNAALKCKYAKKIYYHLLEGESFAEYKEVYKFILSWGFCEIEKEYRPERKLKVLMELLDNMSSLPGANAFEYKFVSQYIHLLEEYEFIPFTRDLDKLKKCMEQIQNEFPDTKQKMHFHKELLELLENFNRYRNNADAKVMESIVKDAGQKIRVLANENPQNDFASRSCEFVDMYVRWREKQGQFTVEILNEDEWFDESIFYQVKNEGIETISDIKLEMYLEKDKIATLQTIIIPEGLHPNQIYAGEYIPKNIGLKTGERVCFILELSYKEDGTYGEKTSVEKILTKMEEKGVCGKRIRGYSNMANAYFVGREKKITEIMEKIDLQSNVVIYGTNGTGKSSILDHLAKEQLPVYCRQKGFIPMILNITVGDKPNAETLIDGGLLDALCGKNGELASKYRELKGAPGELPGMADARAIREEGVVEEKEKKVDANRIRRIFRNISEGLKRENMKLFILWDNFERAIASKEMKASELFFLKDLYDNPGSSENIQIIFAGSNHMLDVMRNGYTKDKNWDINFARSASACEVGNMEPEDFRELITNKVALGEEVRYSEAAIDYLWNYTMGHARYSGIIGDCILDKFKRIKRSVIYPSDIEHAIVTIQKDRASSAKTLETQIFQDISEDTAVICVGKMIADYIMTSSSHTIESKMLWSKVQSERADISEDDYKRAVETLLARGFICEHTMNDTETREKKKYNFASRLYSMYFEKVEIPERKEEKQNNLLEMYSKLSEEEKEDCLWLMYNKLFKEEQEKFRAAIGNTTYVTDNTMNSTVNNILGAGAVQDNTRVESGGTYHKQEIYIKNVENMTATFNSILLAKPGEDIQALYDQLPKYQDYIDENQKEKIRALEMQIENAQSESEAEELMQEKEEEMEAMNEYVSTEMTSSYHQALLGMGESLLFGADDKQLQKMLNVTEEQLMQIKGTIPSELQMQFYFATMLHSIFERFTEVEKVDYCPVTMMYCKLVEAILKKYHTQIYAYELPDEALKAYKDNNSKITFGMSVSEEEGEKEKFENHKHDLTMGSYVYPIYGRIRGVVGIKSWSINKLSQVSETQKSWREHAKNADKILKCRNFSAHESESIKKEVLQALMDTMFKEESVVRMLELVKRWKEEKQR